MCTIGDTCVSYMYAMYTAHVAPMPFTYLQFGAGSTFPNSKGTDGTIGPQNSRSLSRVLSRFHWRSVMLFPTLFCAIFQTRSLSRVRVVGFTALRGHTASVCTREGEDGRGCTDQGGRSWLYGLAKICRAWVGAPCLGPSIGLLLM